MNATFPKTEKLCGQIRIDLLYRRGHRFVVWPLRVTCLPSDEQQSQVLIWASKSLFKHAVDRNRLRRLMREAYRQNKDVLTAGGKAYQVAFNYMDKQIQDYHVIEKAMRRALKRLAAAEEDNKHDA